MKQDAIVTALRGHSEWHRSRGHVDEADAFLDVADMYEANKRDYWATLSEVDTEVAKAFGNRKLVLLLAKMRLRHDWKAPSDVADATMRKLYEQSEWERGRDKLEEGDAFLFVAEVYERLGYDYRATLRAIDDAQSKARNGGSLELAFALRWFRENWTEHTVGAPSVAPAPPTSKAGWPFKR